MTFIESISEWTDKVRFLSGRMLLSHEQFLGLFMSFLLTDGAWATATGIPTQNFFIAEFDKLVKLGLHLHAESYRCIVIRSY